MVDRPELHRLREALRSGATGTEAEREVRALAERLSLVEAFDRLLALHRNRILEYPHQVQAALRVLREMRGRALLADEVGLGKTIEAGLVLKEYLVRGMARTVLILAPPALTRQWQAELSEKFLEEFPLAAAPEDWTRHARVIGSLDTAKQARHAERILSRSWDLVIVDEAHRLCNHRTLAWRLADGLRARHLLLLTATPVQNDLRELFNLITLLRPGQLGSYRSFRARFVDRSDPRRPVNPLRLRLLLSDCMVRNRRSTVDVALPQRRAHIYAIPLDREERRLYEAVSALSRGGKARGTDAMALLLLLRASCSSAEAAAAALRRRSQRDPSLARLAAEAELVGSAAKADALIRIVRDAGDRVLVFTEFRHTQAMLSRRLAEAGLEAVEFHGGLDREARSAVVGHFRARAPVMISTQSGAEGHNLQFCNVLVNFDLPWNPLRLEQRIGRLHRLGQEREVTVFNLAARDTVEADLLDLLANKIRMFELVVGELDLILGLMADESSFEEAVARIWLEAEDSGAYQQRLGELAARISAARERFAGIRETELLLAEVFNAP